MPFYFLCVSSHYILTFLIFSFFFFNDTATTEIYTLSLHDALPIFRTTAPSSRVRRWTSTSISGVSYLPPESGDVLGIGDRKSTRLNSSHLVISYAVFCLKKKKINDTLQSERVLTTQTSKCQIVVLI